MSLIFKSNVPFTGNIKDLPYRYVFGEYVADSIVGVRLLNPDYKGALLQVTRSTDGNKMEVYPEDSAYIDELSVEVFADGGNLTVSKLYDQSGKGNDFFREDVARRPFLVKAGVLQRDSKGFPAIRYDEGNQALVCRNLSLSSSSGVGFYLESQFTGAAVSNVDNTRSAKSVGIGVYSGVNKFIYKSSDTDKADKDISIGGTVNTPSTIITYVNASSSLFTCSVNNETTTSPIVFTQMQNLDAVAIGSDNIAFTAGNNMKGTLSAFAVFSSPATADHLLKN